MQGGWRGLTTAAVIGAAIGVALLASGCSSSFALGSSGAGGKIVAVGAENEYADVIQQVGGKYVQVSAIMSNPNTDPHTFEASASVGRLVNAAQLVVQNGLGYDTFMNTIENAVPDSSRQVIVVQKLLGLPDSTPNPHLWYQPGTMPAVANGDRRRPGRPAARARRVLQGQRGRVHRLAGRVGRRDRGVQGEVPGHAGGDHRAGGGLPAAGGRRRQPHAVGVPGRHHERHRPVGAGRRGAAEPVHPAQGEGVSLQSAGDGLADRILHLAGAGERHPGRGRLRDDAGARIPLPVVDAGRGPGPAAAPWPITSRASTCDAANCSGWTGSGSGWAAGRSSGTSR